MLPTDLVDVLVNGACLHRSDVASLRQSSRSLKDKVDQTLTLLRPSCDLSHVRLVPSAFGVLSTFDMSAFDLRLLSSSQLLASSDELICTLASTLAQLPCLSALVISEGFVREMGRKCWAAAVCDSIFKDVDASDSLARQKSLSGAPPAAAAAMAAAVANAAAVNAAAANVAAAAAAPVAEAQQRQRDAGGDEGEGEDGDAGAGAGAGAAAQRSAANSLPEQPRGMGQEDGEFLDASLLADDEGDDEGVQERLLCHVLNPGPSCLLDCPRELMWTSGYRTFDAAAIQFAINPSAAAAAAAAAAHPEQQLQQCGSERMSGSNVSGAIDVHAFNRSSLAIVPFDSPNSSSALTSDGAVPMPSPSRHAASPGQSAAGAAPPAAAASGPLRTLVLVCVQPSAGSQQQLSGGVKPRAGRERDAAAAFEASSSSTSPTAAGAAAERAAKQQWAAPDLHHASDAAVAVTAATAGPSGGADSGDESGLARNSCELAPVAGYSQPWGRAESSASCGVLTVQGSFREPGDYDDEDEEEGATDVAERAETVAAGEASASASAASVSADLVQQQQQQQQQPQQQPQPAQQQPQLAVQSPARRPRPSVAGQQVQPSSAAAAAPVPVPSALVAAERSAVEPDLQQQQHHELSYFRAAAEDPHANMSAVLWLPDWAARLPRLTSMRIRSGGCAVAAAAAAPGGLPAGVATHTSLLWARRSSLARVRRLDLSGTRLGTLPPDLLAACLPPALQALQLRGCALAALPPSVGALRGLRELNVSRNPALRALPDQVSLLTALTSLDASGCALTSLPACIGTCTALQRLSLSSNALRGPASLPLRELASLPTLEWLSLSDNWLAPPATAAVPALRPYGAVLAAAAVIPTAADLPARLSRAVAAQPPPAADTEGPEEEQQQPLTAPHNWLGMLLTGRVAASLTRLELVNVGPWDQPPALLPWAACLALTALQRLDMSRNCGGVRIGPPPRAHLQAAQRARLAAVADGEAAAEASGSGRGAGGAALPLPLPALRHLNISRCGLEELPTVLQLLPSLRHLDARHNNLPGLPAWAPAMASLHRLDLGGNIEALWALRGGAARRGSSSCAAGGGEGAEVGCDGGKGSMGGLSGGGSDEAAASGGGSGGMSRETAEAMARWLRGVQLTDSDADEQKNGR